MLVLKHTSRTYSEWRCAVWNTYNLRETSSKRKATALFVEYIYKFKWKDLPEELNYTEPQERLVGIFHIHEKYKYKPNASQCRCKHLKNGYRKDFATTNDVVTDMLALFVRIQQNCKCTTMHFQ